MVESMPETHLWVNSRRIGIAWVWYKFTLVSPYIGLNSPNPACLRRRKGHQVCTTHCAVKHSGPQRCACSAKFRTYMQCSAGQRSALYCIQHGQEIPANGQRHLISAFTIPLDPPIPPTPACKTLPSEMDLAKQDFNFRNWISQNPSIYSGRYTNKSWGLLWES